jgi:hypothetical protein
MVPEHSNPRSFHKIQNLSLGRKPTINNAINMSPKIQAYIIILPHHPLPSVIRLKYPILFCAASRLDVFRSKPSVARPSTSFSDSRELEKACEDDFSAFAMVRSESVSDSCSIRLWESIFSVVDIMSTLEEVVRAVSVGCLGSWAWRERRSEGRSSSRCSRSVRSGADGGDAFPITGMTCSSTLCFGITSFSSMSSDGVSSPSISSPADESSSVSCSNCRSSAIMPV